MLDLGGHKCKIQCYLPKGLVLLIGKLFIIYAINMNDFNEHSELIDAALFEVSILKSSLPAAERKLHTMFCTPVLMAFFCFPRTRSKLKSKSLWMFVVLLH